MEISTQRQLVLEMQKVLDKVLWQVGLKVKEIMINILGNSPIYSSDMTTFARYVECIPKDNRVDIFVNFEKMSDRERGEYDSGWGRYQNTFGENIGSVYWQDNLITFKMAQWLNGDVKQSGNLIGNQPLRNNEWFIRTENEVNKQLKTLTQKYLRQLGFQLKR